ncbi:hypothetical protein BC830DRAFT_1151828 [Chytriomyces sp. MP71]|nr:hypothetical protein BC830DRAFT_1151828 [Chytriomyces sp. MP71]
MWRRSRSNGDILIKATDHLLAQSNFITLEMRREGGRHTSLTNDKLYTNATIKSCPQCCNPKDFHRSLLERENSLHLLQMREVAFEDANATVDDESVQAFRFLEFRDITEGTFWTDIVEEVWTQVRDYADTTVSHKNCKVLKLHCRMRFDRRMWGMGWLETKRIDTKQFRSDLHAVKESVKSQGSRYADLY